MVGDEGDIKKAGVSSDQTVPAACVSKKADKVKIHFVPVGSAPLMKKSKFGINSSESWTCTTFKKKL